MCSGRSPNNASSLLWQWTFLKTVLQRMAQEDKISVKDVIVKQLMELPHFTIGASSSALTSSNSAVRSTRSSPRVYPSRRSMGSTRRSVPRTPTRATHSQGTLDRTTPGTPFSPGMLNHCKANGICCNDVHNRCVLSDCRFTHISPTEKRQLLSRFSPT